MDMAQPKIDMAVEWGAQNGLSFSVDKTSVVFFSRQHKFHKEVLPRLKKLTINGVDINPSESMTYLSIVLDQKLSWTPHIQKKVLVPRLTFFFFFYPQLLQSTGG